MRSRIFVEIIFANGACVFAKLACVDDVAPIVLALSPSRTVCVVLPLLHLLQNARVIADTRERPGARLGKLYPFTSPLPFLGTKHAEIEQDKTLGVRVGPF